VAQTGSNNDVTVGVKNVTLSINETVLSAVRNYAAERSSSVNALVREFLGAIAEREDRARKLRARTRAVSDSSEARVITEHHSI